MVSIRVSQSFNVEIHHSIIPKYRYLQPTWQQRQLQLDMQNREFDSTEIGNSTIKVTEDSGSGIISRLQTNEPLQMSNTINEDDDSISALSSDQQEEEGRRNESEDEKSSMVSKISEDSEYQIEDEQPEPIQDEELDEEENVRLQLEDQEVIDDQEQQSGQDQKEKELKPKGQKMKIHLRNFQATLIENSLDRNSIIYLPTGAGKTRIAICSMYYYLCKYGTTRKIVFLANTIQLVKQQAEAIKQTLAAIISNQNFAKDLRQKLGGNYIDLNWTEKDLHNQVVCVHGERSQDPTVTKRKRIEAYLTSKKEFLNEIKKATVTVMISQMFLNCLRRGYIKLTDYSFMVFDQCHHCGGDHPYSGIMKEFYYEHKKKLQKDEKLNRLRQDQNRLPILMGLTASPVSQPYDDYQRLTKELKNLCVNLDSNYAYYPFGEQIKNKTEIDIENIKEPQEKELIPGLISYFDRYKDHSTSYAKIKVHFPDYYECVKQVIDLMSAHHQSLKIDAQDSNIVDPQLFLLYDIKECLLLKLRDLWLQLGQFAFSLGFHEMNTELARLTGLRNPENTQLLEKVKAVLKFYGYKFKQKYGRCKKQFMSSKLLRLIEILKPQSEEQKLKDKVGDMVLVFAFKRRTVKYLQLVIDKYRDQLPENQKKFYKSVGVTGYATRQKIYKVEDGHSFQPNPSAEEDESTIAKLYGTFVEREREQLRNRILLNNSFAGQNQNLNSQMSRLFFSKMSKMLLQVEQKYHNQIKKIIQFRKKEHRVLITTSVTEQGFDIPGCNLVISFDTPFSMKSYIQIKGRARKKNSKYIIFTNQNHFEKIQENKKIYDNTINAIYQLAINRISKEEIDGLEKIQYSNSYEKVATKGGALLNTNYSLQLLKSYFTSLKPPNRPYFHFIETSNICYKCIIKFPESSTCSVSYVVGKPQPRKDEAMKSAAFIAVKILKKEGFIRDDLRPSRIEELEDQVQLERYDDLGLYGKDNSYKQIFDRYVQIVEFNNPHTYKKLTQFYFKALQPERLEFHNLNRHFSIQDFNKSQQFPFQIYLVKFSNTIKCNLLSQSDQANEIGILTCFQKQETEEMFARFTQRLESTCKEQFELRIVEKSLMVTKADYEKYKTVHNFLLAAYKNNEPNYYNFMNKEPPVLFSPWMEAVKKKIIKFDQSRQFFPLMVLLRRQREGKSAYYQIDQPLNCKVIEHIELFKRIYTYQNKPPKSHYNAPFEENLLNNYKLLIDTVQGQDPNVRKYIVQCISSQMCLQKCVFSTKIIHYNRQIQNIDEIRKKNKLKPKYQKLKKQFPHFSEDKRDIYQEQVVKIQTWRNASKEDLNEILNNTLALKKGEDQKGTYRFLKQFILYPISYPTMIRVALVSRYVFQVIEDHSIALYFRKFYLSEIFGHMKGKIKLEKEYKFAYYKNIILDYLQKICQQMCQGGKSRHLRQLGRLLISNSNLNLVNIHNDISSIDLRNMSASQDTSMIRINQSNSNILNQSGFQESLIQEQPSRINQQQQQMKISKSSEHRLNLDILKDLKIEDILRALTSKIYKHQKIFNYEEFQFIGDVVLKYLATMQIFLEKINCQEGEMHIARANIICNANLHRAAIRKKLFQYIFTTKHKSEPTPLVTLPNAAQKIQEKKKFGNTDIDVLSPDDDDTGYQYIPGKVHADVMQALIGIFYLKSKNLNDCQTLLYAFGVLSKPNLSFTFDTTNQKSYPLPPHLSNVQSKLGYYFKHKELLVQALTHPSFLNYIEDAVDDQEQSFSKLFNSSNNSQLQNSQFMNFSLLADKTTQKECTIKKHQTFYERMEFLGDAFLDLVVVQYLYDQGGDYLDDQGTLSFLKQSAVSNKTLGFIALKENLHEYMFIDIDNLDQTMKQFRKISKEMQGMPTPLKFSQLKIGSLKILGDVFQSLIGAILIDNQFRYEDTKAVIMNFMQKYIKHFTNISFVSQCPTFKYKEYLDQNNYKNYKLVKVLEEGIINGQYLYKLTDKSGNMIGKSVRAPNDKDAWDILLEEIKETK